MQHQNNSIDSQPAPIAPSRRASYGAADKRNPWRIGGIAVSILFHAILFWYLLHIKTATKKAVPPGERGGTLVYLGSHSANKPVRPKRPPASKPAQEQIHLAVRPRTPPPLPPKIEIPEIPVPAAEPPPEDMMARIEANRQKRDYARAQRAMMETSEQISEHQESEAERANRIARENIASAQSRSGHQGGGGIFELRHQGFHHAEFVFRGWSNNSHRNALQLIEVDQGTEADIQIAVIKRMIQIIRAEKEGDFTWESGRLGRALTLSARIEDTAGLQQFLMSEFFPDHAQQAMR